MTENLQAIREQLANELIPDKHHHNFYLCPLCGSGTGKVNSDGAVHIQRDGIHAKCFSCGFYGDIFDWEAAKTGKSLPEATKDVISRYEHLHHSTGFSKATAQVPPQPKAEKAPVDFSARLRFCADRLFGSEGERYLSGRGFSQETMRRFMLGYDPVKKEITIPYNRACTYYSTRRIDPNATIKHMKPDKEEADSVLFNAAALRQDEPCFVVESPLCAISIMQEGGTAVALAGAANHELLLKTLADVPSPPMLILSLDTDQTGQEQQRILSDKLTAAGINHIDFCASVGCKDPNELLQKDPSALRALVLTGCAAAKDYADSLKEEAAAAYMETSTSGTFDDFLEYLRRNSGRKPVPTGFDSLDKILNGGLVPGLYIMGAVSSLGKTALMVNIADNIAASGTDVLYFSLEMSKYELIARSVSRLSYRMAGDRKANIDEAFSTFGVLFGSKHIDGKDSLLRDAMDKYRQTIGPHIWYFEGVGSINVDFIREKVRTHIAKTGRKPVVFVDYLQIIAPPDPRATDKHNTDVIVTTLKQLSRDEDVSVFCISSLNRMNYNEPVNMAAFKESGAIEYGSDVLIGLQLYGIGYKPGEKQDAHSARVQELITKAEKEEEISIQVRVLKNRNGKRGDSNELKFTKRFNSFFEAPDGCKIVQAADNPFADDEAMQKTFRL